MPTSRSAIVAALRVTSRETSHALFSLCGQSQCGAGWWSRGLARSNPVPRYAKTARLFLTSVEKVPSSAAILLVSGRVEFRINRRDCGSCGDSGGRLELRIVRGRPHRVISGHRKGGSVIFRSRREWQQRAVVGRSSIMADG